MGRWGQTRGGGVWAAMLRGIPILNLFGGCGISARRGRYVMFRITLLLMFHCGVCADDSYLMMMYLSNARTVHSKFPNFSGLLPANDEQKSAVRAAMSQPFTAIQGPPGTGKTVTVVRLTVLYVHLNQTLDSRYQKNNIKPQLMICGPSNKSVDVIAGDS